MKAFPSPHDPKTGTMQLGMELRDYFAAYAMQAIICQKDANDGGLESANIAWLAYQVADAMMKARDE